MSATKMTTKATRKHFYTERELTEHDRKQGISCKFECARCESLRTINVIEGREVALNSNDGGATWGRDGEVGNNCPGIVPSAPKTHAAVATQWRDSVPNEGTAAH